MVAPLKIRHKPSLERRLPEVVSRISILLYDNYLLQVLQELPEVHMVTIILTSLRKYARNMAAKFTADEGLLELFNGQISDKNR